MSWYEVITTVVNVIVALGVVAGIGKIWWDVRQVHKSVNSRLDEMVDATSKLAFKAGQESEKKG